MDTFATTNMQRVRQASVTQASQNECPLKTQLHLLYHNFVIIKEVVILAIPAPLETQTPGSKGLENLEPRGLMEIWFPPECPIYRIPLTFLYFANS